MSKALSLPVLGTAGSISKDQGGGTWPETEDENHRDAIGRTLPSQRVKTLIERRIEDK